MTYQLRLLILAWMLAGTSIGCALVGYDELIRANGGNGAGGSINTGGRGDASITNSGGSTASGGVIIVGATGGSMTGGAMAIRDASIVNTGGTIAASGGDAVTGGTVIIGVIDSGTSDSGVSTNMDSGMADASIPDASILVDSSIPPDPDYGSLVHRYSFSPSNTGPAVVEDLVGDADGQLQGGANFSSSGTLTLDGSGGYVDLPDGLVSSLTNATFVVWFSYGGGSCGQRVFDFGSSASSFDLNTRNCLQLPIQYILQQNAATINYIDNGTTSLYLGPSQLSAGSHMMAVVIDADANTLNWYVDGTLVNSNDLVFSLSSLNDVNNWLGRSNTGSDPYLGGSFDEFRIYDAALSAVELVNIRSAGPDSLP